VAVATINCFSDVLEVGVTFTVVLPQVTQAQVGVESVERVGDPPVLYLLHGLSDDHSAWTRYTSVERYADARGLAVVMPAVSRSFYADEAGGHRYWTFVSEELPQLVRTFFRVSTDPAQTFVAGLSMGGYGALRLALTYPERYAAVASLSGAVDVRALMREPGRARLNEVIFAGEVPPEADLFSLVRSGRSLPPMWIGCGTEDILYPMVRDFEAAAQGVGADVTTLYEPGDHVWELWDAQLPVVLDFLLSHGDSARSSVAAR